MQVEILVKIRCWTQMQKFFFFKAVLSDYKYTAS